MLSQCKVLNGDQRICINSGVSWGCVVAVIPSSPQSARAMITDKAVGLARIFSELRFFGAIFDGFVP